MRLIFSISTIDEILKRDKEPFQFVTPGNIVVMVSKESGNMTDICVMSYNRFLISLQGHGTVYKSYKNLEENYDYIRLTENDSIKLENNTPQKYTKRQNYK